MKLNSNSQLLASLIDPQLRRVAQEKAGEAAVRQNPAGASGEQQSLKDAVRSQKIAQNLEALQKTQTDIRAKNIAKLRETLGLNATSAAESALVGGQSEFNAAILKNSNHRESFGSSQPNFIKLGQIIDIRV